MFATEEKYIVNKEIASCKGKAFQTSGKLEYCRFSQAKKV